MKFRKKPVVVEAQQFTDESKNRVFHWVGGATSARFDADGKPILLIQTLEGVMTTSLGDWIIKGVNGEFYPCKPDIFEMTYEPADRPDPRDTQLAAIAAALKSAVSRIPWSAKTVTYWEDDKGTVVELDWWKKLQEFDAQSDQILADYRAKVEREVLEKVRACKPPEYVVLGNGQKLPFPRTAGEYAEAIAREFEPKDDTAARPQEAQ